MARGEPELSAELSPGRDETLPEVSPSLGVGEQISSYMARRGDGSGEGEEVQ